MTCKASGRDPYLVPGLMKGLDVLQAFTAERREMTLGDIAAELGVTRSAAFRVAYTLSRLGFLVHDTDAQTFGLGPAVLRLSQGYSAHRHLVETALPHLRTLSERTGWSAHLGVLEDREVLYVLRIPARRGLVSIVRVGTRLPAHATSMGRVLLASLGEEAVASLYRNVELVPRSSGPGLPSLLRQHRQDRQQGLVVHNGGFEAGVASVAAAIRDMRGRVAAAINVSTADAAMRSMGAMEAAARHVREAAAACSGALSSVQGRL